MFWPSIKIVKWFFNIIYLIGGHLLVLVYKKLIWFNTYFFRWCAINFLVQIKLIWCFFQIYNLAQVSFKFGA
jgi:hypothetical protein